MPQSSTSTPTLIAPLNALHISGPESRDFLNRLIISDLEKPSALPFSGICNPKGRLLFTFWLLPQDENEFLLFTDPALFDELLQFFHMRRFRSRLAIEPVNGPQLALSADSSDKPQVQLVADSTEKTGAADKASEWPDYWLWLMRHHLPWIQPDTQGLFIPQQLDLQHHGVVSVNKGCYPGQEIIARLHFLGKNKKHLYHCLAQLSESLNDLTTQVKNGADVHDCHNKQIFTLASPLIADQNQMHFQLVGIQAPACVKLSDQQITVTSQRPGS